MIPRNRHTRVGYRAAQRRMNSHRDIVGFTANYEAGDTTGMHSHDRAQLVHGETGVMSVRTERGTWLVPPGFAVWVPAAMEHQVIAVTALRMATLYVLHEAKITPLQDCTVVSVPTLARELILRAVALPDRYPDGGPESRLIGVLRDELMALTPAPLHLPLPADRRARSVTDHLIEKPSDGRELDDWGREVGASGRTLARLFTSETGLSFGRWRQRRRLLAALERLASGSQVTTVALDLGYKSPSAFIAMFRRELGTTPGRYLKDARVLPSR